MKLSVIIVNYNVKYFLELCLHSVLKAAASIDAEIIVVDNNSKDDSCALVKNKFPSVLLIENKDNKGFSKANNQAVAVAQGEYILFLNPDTVMPEDFLVKMLEYMDRHPEAGAIGPRLIDGKGAFAPDAKKSFPTMSVALFKTTGINRLFSKSPYFNKYYAVHVGEHETASVEGLSGCCMMLRKSAMDNAGGAFDESYFMYCEDVDLCYRVQQAGYQVVYFPQVTLIHYKGESTKKATLSYLRTFNNALITFVKKHYTARQARMFIFLIHIGILLRRAISAVKILFRILRMPLFDALVLLLTLFLIKDFWVVHVKNIMPIPLSSIYATFPVYIGLWLLSLYLNGAYDQPYRAFRVMRGMIIGTLLVMAYYGLLLPSLRYSRAIIIFTGFAGTVLLLGLHELLYRLGIFKFTQYEQQLQKTVIVATPEEYKETAATLQHVHHAPQVAGRVRPSTDNEKALADVANLKELLYSASINEVIFSVKDITYNDIFRQMEHCGTFYDYKIHLPGSQSFVGSNSSHTAGDLYTIDRRYNLGNFSQLRNKRLVDVGGSLILLLLSPVILWFVRNKGSFVSNCLAVLTGKKTWVGYTTVPEMDQYLPQIRNGILPPYNMIDSYQPDLFFKTQLNISYAEHYNAMQDVALMLNNLKYLGKK